MENIALKIGMFGQPGAGKTFSAIRMAKGMVSDVTKIAVLNTEDTITSIYKKRLGDFFLQNFAAPYSPDRYIAAFDYLVKQGYELIIVDSISHEWVGSGGCLEIHAKLGGRFADWAKVSPMHNLFIDAIVKCPVHMILTGRKKTEYVIEQNANGKLQPIKKGLEDITRDGFSYEITLSLDLDQRHMATPTKDRTGLFMSDEKEPIPFLITEQTGLDLINYFK